MQGDGGLVPSLLQWDCVWGGGGGGGAVGESLLSAATCRINILSQSRILNLSQILVSDERMAQMQTEIKDDKASTINSCFH